ncbi:L-threonylcarbamoyladenylate synthase [Endozoicomonadaceae bacterium StTr2]
MTSNSSANSDQVKSHKIKSDRIKSDVQSAATEVIAGGVIAYPTEAVWGLGCDPWNQKAVERILEIKRRPMEKGLILVAADEQSIAPLLQSLAPEQVEQMRQTWPGPVTWVIPDPKGWTPDWVRGRHSSIAVRISSHPVVQALCKSWGGPLVSTSANRAGDEPLRTGEDVANLLGAEVDCIVDGEVGSLNSEPSRIFDLVSGKQLR